MDEIEKREAKISQAYQVIGALTGETASEEEMIRALDYFADPTTYDENFLPFIVGTIDQEATD